MSQIAIDGVISRLGVAKNPVLASSSAFSGFTMYNGVQLVHEAATGAVIFGMVLAMLAIVIFLIALGFYIYAFLRLPSSIMEQIFLQEGRAAVEHHDRATRNRRNKDSEPNEHSAESQS